MKSQILSLLLGFSIWLVATLAFTFWGHLFFSTATVGEIFMFYGVPVPLLFLLMRFIFNKLRLSPTERLQNTILLCLPGLCLDALCFRHTEAVFPHLSAQLSLQLCSLVLWIYAVVLLCGLYLQLQEKDL